MNRKLMNKIGGIPDLLASTIPNFVLRKNTLRREQYIKQLEFYYPKDWPAEEKPFLYIPKDAPVGETIKVKDDSGCKLHIIKYPSRYVPRHPHVTKKYESFQHNKYGYLHLWRHSPQNFHPLVFCIHGFQMGSPARSRRLFKIKKLLSMGVDVALYTLPFHWKREEKAARHFFLNPNDIPLTLESFAQNIHDLHSAILLLREMGCEKVGAIGASLGGYTGALYATQAAPLDFIFTAVPAIDLWDYLKPKSGGFAFEVDESIIDATRKALQVISPLHYPPKFDVKNISVVLHGGDRICRPQYIRSWIEKWGIENVVEVAGGHWLYLDRRIRGATWYGLLAAKGYI